MSHNNFRQDRLVFGDIDTGDNWDVGSYES